jgi:ABC-type glycerol-3-phosphate transport system substrate-binding protein
MDYSENPSIQYTLTKTWGEEDKSLAFEFWTPAAGTAADNYTTMIASGDLPDIIDAVISEPPQVMYESGYAMDITEYVERNMPNYVALVHSDDSIYKNCVTIVDGEEHYYALRNIFDQPEDIFEGYMYRRDWIVKYGTNPQTGAAFTGGYTDENDPDSWTDDVVFPSGGSDPVYISDWEWMFGIFETAMADLGIDDSYCMSLYYPGFTWSGGLISSFGGGTNVWYEADDGTVQFGGDTDQMRAYLECMNTWYENGWLDQSFNQRTSDAFYAIDDTSVRQGKVGMWNGLQSELGGRIDAHDGGYTEGIFVAGAAYPINDIYGTDACKNVEPNCVMGGGLVSGGIIITTAAEGKDLDTLCSYLDYFYSTEGALIKALGLNADQVSELESATGDTFYSDYGLADGAYTVNGDTYVKSDTLVNDSGNLLIACSFDKVCGLAMIKDIDNGYADTFEASIKSWSQYPNTALFNGTITTDSMTAEDSTACGNVQSKVLEYMTNNAYDFISGKKDIANDSDWDTWCKSLQKYNYQKVSDIYQTYVDEYPFR